MEPVKLEHNGVQYFAELGKIDSTNLGREDHGIMSFCLHLSFADGSTKQGAGAYNLNNHTIFGNMVTSILNLFGCDWEQLPGSRVWALREDQVGLIRGLMHENCRDVLIFKEVFDEVNS